MATEQLNKLSDAIELLASERKQHREDITHSIHLLMVAKVVIRSIWRSIEDGLDKEALKMDVEAIFTLLNDIDNLNRSNLAKEFEKEGKENTTEPVLH